MEKVAIASQKKTGEKETGFLRKSLHHNQKLN
jgi:hypothetical protein